MPGWTLAATPSMLTFHGGPRTCTDMRKMASSLACVFPVPGSVLPGMGRERLLFPMFA